MPTELKRKSGGALAQGNPKKKPKKPVPPGAPAAAPAPGGKGKKPKPPGKPKPPAPPAAAAEEQVQPKAEAGAGEAAAPAAAGGAGEQKMSRKQRDKENKKRQKALKRAALASGSGGRGAAEEPQEDAPAAPAQSDEMTELLNSLKTACKGKLSDRLNPDHPHFDPVLKHMWKAGNDAGGLTKKQRGALVAADQSGPPCGGPPTAAAGGGGGGDGPTREKVKGTAWFPTSSVIKGALPTDGSVTSISICLFYQYVRPRWSEARKSEAFAWMETTGAALNLGGRLRVALEGMNATVSGTRDSVRAFAEALKGFDASFKETDYKYIDDLPLDRAFKDLVPTSPPILLL